MTNPFDLSSMRIAISGAGGGIGSATARLVADVGADVMLSDLEAPTPLADQIRSRGRSAAAAGFDVNGAMHFSQTGRLAAPAEHSGRQADGTTATKIGDATLDSWNAVMSVNATGVFLGIKHVIRSMREAGGGSIINVSSIYGIVGSVHSAAYHASKGAVRTLTKCAAIQYAGDRIRVNSVHPGFVDTPMTEAIHADPDLARPRLAATPLGRFGRPYDIAMGCTYLASDEAEWMTGAELVIDGEMIAQ